MSIERQPGKLATANLRRAVSEMQKNKAKVKPQTRTGLLSRNNMVESRNKTEEKTSSESKKVLDYMIAIREAMSVDDNEESV